jgi:ribonuclease P protein component
VVRLRAGFDRKQFISATSDALKAAVRSELEQLFNHAVATNPTPKALAS